MALCALHHSCSDDTINLLSVVIYYYVYLRNRYIHLIWQLPKKQRQSYDSDVAHNQDVSFKS